MKARHSRGPRYRHAIVAIVKNEWQYLAEWIAYHRLIGFEHFYIADNGSDDGTELLLSKWQSQGLVTTERWTPEDRAQTLWYQHVLATWGSEVRYLTFIDVDEFIVHPYCDRPLEWLEPLLAPDDVGAVAINWRIFGSAGMQFRQPGGVLARFSLASRCDRAVNRHVKSIVKPAHVESMTAHTAKLKPGYRYLTGKGEAAEFLGAKADAGRTETVIDTPIKVYHYNIKSFEEFVDTKMPRGRANMAPDNMRDLDYFHNHDINDERVSLSPALLKRVAQDAHDLAPESDAHPSPPRFFVHIPKTAGTSFRLGAKDALGEGMVWHDYGETQRETAPEVTHWAYRRRDMWRLWQIMEARGVQMLGGHVKLEKYAHLAGLRNCFAFVREPLQRLASEYHHFVRHHGFEDSFSAFYQRRDMINRQSSFLEATRLEALGLVGLTERYAESLELLNALYGWDIESMAENLGHASVDHVYEIEPEDEQAIRRLNGQDFELYARAEEIFSRRVALRASGLPYAHGAIQQCQVDRVVGWAWWSEDDSPVELEVRVNDERVGRCLANALRPGFLRWGAPRGAYVGFHLPLKTHPGDRVEVRTIMTQQSLGSLQIGCVEQPQTSLEP